MGFSVPYWPTACEKLNAFVESFLNHNLMFNELKLTFNVTTSERDASFL